MRYGIPGAFLIPLGSNPDISISIFRYYCVFDTNYILRHNINSIDENYNKIWNSLYDLSSFCVR